MTSDMRAADVVFLAHSSQRNFDGWMGEYIDLGKVPVRAKWVFDCVAHGEVLPVDGYVLDAYTAVVKRRQVQAEVQGAAPLAGIGGLQRSRTLDFCAGEGQSGTVPTVTSVLGRCIHIVRMALKLDN